MLLRSRRLGVSSACTSWWRSYSTASQGKNKYSHTLNLPSTNFPMRADAAKREPALQEHITAALYKWQVREDPPVNTGLICSTEANNKGDLFVLHDGPPYANGSLHIGHFLNKVTLAKVPQAALLMLNPTKTLNMFNRTSVSIKAGDVVGMVRTQVMKDIFVRYNVMKGRKVSFIPGWDCHGLPIELKALEKLSQAERKALQPLELRARARNIGTPISLITMTIRNASLPYQPKIGKFVNYISAYHMHPSQSHIEDSKRVKSV
eukprot:9418037-Pyramimonas_sp.AAC.1